MFVYTLNQWFPTNGMYNSSGTWEQLQCIVVLILEIPLINKKEYEYIFMLRNVGQHVLHIFLQAK